MMIEKSAKSVEEAIKAALQELGISENQASVEILEQPSKGFLGLGSKLAKVRVTKKEAAPSEKKEEQKAPKEVKEARVGKEVVKETGFKPVSAEAKKAHEAASAEHVPYDERRIPATMDDKEIAHKFIRDMLNAMDIKAEIRSKVSDEGLYINLTGAKMGLIIGRRGQTLDSLQYLVSLVVNKNKPKNSHVKVVVDTEDYRQKREETLERLAKRLADKVARSGQYVELEPMNPYERRIIHATLQNYRGVVTYSEGEEPNRKVIIDISKD